MPFSALLRHFDYRHRLAGFHPSPLYERRGVSQFSRTRESRDFLGRIVAEIRGRHQESSHLLLPPAAGGQPPSITTTLHQIGWLVSGNCIGERTGAKLSCKLAYSREGIPKIPFMPTVVVILAGMRRQQIAQPPEALA